MEAIQAKHTTLVCGSTSVQSHFSRSEYEYDFDSGPHLSFF